MAVDAKNVLVGGPDQATTGAILSGDDTSTLPTKPGEAPGAGWGDSGYISEDGLTLTPERSMAGIKDWSGATVKEHWMDTERTLLSQMRELEPDACAEYLSFVRATIRTNNRLLESSPLPHDNEVTLLAVDRDVHGLGVGTVLLDAAVSHLSSLGATRAHLYTDSNCSWKFYELHGFKRTATHRANREERRHAMPRESFLYELDLTA